MKPFPPFEFRADKISKSFDGFRTVFSSINAELRNGEVLGVIGWNGSGKSTLMKIFSGTLMPSSGSLTFHYDGNMLDKEILPMHIGFIAPYLTVYEEFSPKEHARIFCEMSGVNFDESWYESLIAIVGLKEHESRPIKAFSSGMKQRVKYLLAMMRKNPILLLDEPSTNLDSKGQDIFRTILNMQKEMGGGTIIATNEQAETQFCDRIIPLSTM
jgi:heme exporter protein A